jgi:hypothetical protein
MNIRGCIFRVNLDNDSKVLTLKNVNDIVFIRDERIVTLSVGSEAGSQYET